MCIGIPSKVIEINEGMGKVDYHGVVREASFVMLPEAEVGDFVILHAGFAIKKLSADEAAETLKLIEEMIRAGEEVDEC